MCWRLVGPCYSGVPNISVETFTYFNSFSHKTCLFWSTCINNTLCRCTFQQETFWRGAHRVCLLKNNNIYVTNQILVQVCRVAIEHDKLLSVWLHLKSLSAWLTLCCLIWEYILIQKHGWKCKHVLLLGSLCKAVLLANSAFGRLILDRQSKNVYIFYINVCFCKNSHC